ncbi:MAG: hypothetical protein ACI8W7_004126, partial [Gammaproteobacteria bacterium]
MDASLMSSDSAQSQARMLLILQHARSVASNAALVA